VIRTALAHSAAVVLVTALLAAPTAYAQEYRDTAPASEQKLQGRPSVQVLAEIKTARAAHPRWCGDKLIFPNYRTLFAASANGAAEALADVQQPIDVLSVACSRDGKTILFMNVAHDRLFIFEDSQLSEYTVSWDGIAGIRYGSLLSPDGKTLAIPGTMQLARGPDALKPKRVLQTETSDIFWTNRHVIQRRKDNRFVMSSLSDPKTERTLTFPEGILINGIHECGSGSHFVSYSDPADRTYIASLNNKTLSLGPKPIQSNNIGIVASTGDECIVPVNKETAGINFVNQLVFLRGASKRSINVSHLKLFNESFALSKDARMLATFQIDRIGREAGRVLIFNVADAPPQNP
jgi:hypothetical protein